MAKRLDLRYQPDKRVMTKIKHERTADCVVAGYRVHKSDPVALGSLLLGLYDDRGVLVSVGVVGAFPMARRRQLLTELQPLVTSFDDHPWAWARQVAGERTRVSPRPAAGTPARICRSPRCARSGSSRSATTTWKVSGSATPPSSSAGAPTATPAPAPTTSSPTPSTSPSPTSSRAPERGGSAPPGFAAAQVAADQHHHEQQTQADQPDVLDVAAVVPEEHRE